MLLKSIMSLVLLMVEANNDAGMPATGSPRTDYQEG